MREIKFRAWKHTDSPEMFNDVVMVDFENKIVWIRYKISEQKYRKDYVDFSKLELMQYTGLKDVQGVDIYEGDILKYFGECREVIYRESSFGWMEDGNYYAFTEMSPSEIPKTEVIGNIYENPELLGDSQ